jgi:hypothetical protein
MALKRKNEVLLQYQVSKRYYKKIIHLVDFFIGQYESGKLEYGEALMYVDSVAKFNFLYEEVSQKDLILWSFVGQQKQTPQI